MALALGSKVRCTYVDMYGFQGREKHPTQADIGFEGYVSHIIDQSADLQCEYICYLVSAGDKELELMSFEVEEVLDEEEVSAQEMELRYLSVEEDESPCEIPASECQALYVILTRDAKLAADNGDHVTAIIQEARAELAASYRGRAL